MLQTVSMMVSLLLSAGAVGVIGVALAEDRQALRNALLLHDGAVRMALPPRTHRVVAARRARFIRLASPKPLSAAA